MTILLIYFFSGAGNYEGAAIQKCIEAWPGVSTTSIRALITLSSLVSVPVMLLISPLVGKKISYKTLMTGGALLAFTGGVLPFFYAPSWNFILACRILIGIGTGFFGVRNALLLKTVPAEQRNKYVGLGNVAMYSASLISSPLCGLLADWNWKYSFLINGIGLFIAVMILLFLKEPEKAEPQEVPELMGGEIKHVKISGWVYLLTGMQLLMTGTKYPLLSGMSTLIAERGLGSAALAGTVMSSYTVGAIVGGLLLSWIKKRIGKNAMTLNMILVAAGMFFVYAMPTVWGAFAGSFVTGIAFNTSYAINQIYVANLAPKHQMAFCSTLVFAANNLGVYISSFFINFCQNILHLGSDIESGIVGGAACFLLMSVFTFFARNHLEKEDGTPSSKFSEAISKQ